jgi:hypothetical protein
MPAADQEIDTALRLVLQAVTSMPGHGVTSPHVIPTALVMVALPLMEATTSRATIAAWLLELHETYAEGPEDERRPH